MTHTFGGRNDSPSLFKHQKKFFDEVFFPTLEKNEIDTILHMGDVFDRRKFINFNSLKQTKEIFLNPIKNKNIKMHVIAGNHDTFYKNTNDINSLQLLLGEYSNNIEVYSDDIKELNFGKTRFVMVPWLNSENSERILKNLKRSKSDYVLGHFEIVGFVMSGGQKCTHGLNQELFSNFEKVMSGHFHVPSKKGNVEYIGAPYQMDWSDYGGERGFYIMDCDSKGMEFIKNPYTLFNIIDYDDTDAEIDDLKDIDETIFEDVFIRINPTKITNPALFEKFVNKIENFKAADVKIREIPYKKEETEENKANELDFDVEDTLSFISAYVEKSGYEGDMATSLKDKLFDLYKRSKK